MVQTFRFRGRVWRWGMSVSAVVSVLFLLGCGAGRARAECRETEPADEFSQRIDSLLMEVEGSDFPRASNLDSWNQRRGDMKLKFAEILEIASNNVARRKATIEALLAAESLSVKPSESTRLIDSSRGETRPWARKKLTGYSSIGVTPEDRKLGASIITELKESWNDQQTEHPQKNLPLYEEKAAALGDLATFYQSPSCDKKP